MSVRKIKNTFKGIDTTDGAAVNITRIIGSSQLDMLDPFLQLPTPEKGYIDNQPRTPKPREMSDSPPPLRYKFMD